MNGDGLVCKRFMVAVVKGRLKTDFQTTFAVETSSVVYSISRSCVGNHRVVYTFSTADSFCFCLNDS